MAKLKRADRFVYGYVSRGNLVFGREGKGGSWRDAAEPMTRVQAERAAEKMPSRGCAVFELVPVGTPTKKATRGR